MASTNLSNHTPDNNINGFDCFTLHDQFDITLQSPFQFQHSQHQPQYGILDRALGGPHSQFPIGNIMNHSSNNMVTFSSLNSLPSPTRPPALTLKNTNHSNNMSASNMSHSNMSHSNMSHSNMSHSNMSHSDDTRPPPPNRYPPAPPAAPVQSFHSFQSTQIVSNMASPTMLPGIDEHKENGLSQWDPLSALNGMGPFGASFPTALPPFQSVPNPTGLRLRAPSGLRPHGLRVPVPSASPLSPFTHSQLGLRSPLMLTPNSLKSPTLKSKPNPLKSPTLKSSAINLEMVKSMDLTKRRNFFGDRLFPLVDAIEPLMARKVTGMLLEMTPEEIQKLLNDENALKFRINQSVNVLKESGMYPVDNQEKKSNVSPTISELENTVICIHSLQLSMHKVSENEHNLWCLS